MDKQKGPACVLVSFHMVTELRVLRSECKQRDSGSI